MKGFVLQKCGKILTFVVTELDMQADEMKHRSTLPASDMNYNDDPEVGVCIFS